jgi:hypothetical protein
MRKMLLYAIAVLIVMPAMGPTAWAQKKYPVTEPIEWMWAQAPEKKDAALPNVLLVGDSITRAYYAETAKLLAGKANVYLFATSCGVGDSRLPGQLRDYFAMLPVKYAVVHFNNGMHGWGYTEDQFRAAFPALVRSVRVGAPKAKLIWASITPVRVDQGPGKASNARIIVRNAIAQDYVDQMNIPLDNQNALMVAHNDMHSDDVHYNAAGSALQAAQVVKYVTVAMQ